MLFNSDLELIQEQYLDLTEEHFRGHTLPFLFCKLHSFYYVRRFLALGDQGWLALNHGIPNLTNFSIVIICGSD